VEELGMSCVRLEVMPWLGRYFDAERLGAVILEKDVVDGTTVGDLMKEMASQNEEFGRVLFDERSGRLAPHIRVILNGRVLELAGGLEAKLKDGDTIRLVAGIGGG
jgi:molybdopterin synthase sulfur carrier subunit